MKPDSSICFSKDWRGFSRVVTSILMILLTVIAVGLLSLSSILPQNNLRHGLAWAVFDESTKLPIALPEPDEKSVTADVARMSAAPLPGYTAATKRNWSSLKLLADQRSKLITPHHSGLANLASADRSFHDLANGLLVGSAFTGRKNTFYRLNLLPEKRADEIIMAPGEHLVLTASNHTQSFSNKFSSEGIDQKEPWSHHQYGLQWEAMTDWPPASPMIKISNANNREYGDPEIYAHSGLEFATPSSIRSGEGDRTLLDHSYYANSALFDSYFFSILAAPGEPLDRRSTVKDAISGLFDKGTPLAIPRFIRRRGGLDTQEITAALTAKLLREIQRALVVLFHAPTGGKESYSSLVLNHDHQDFPLGVYRLISISPHPVRSIPDSTRKVAIVTE